MRAAACISSQLRKLSKDINTAAVTKSMVPIDLSAPRAIRKKHPHSTAFSQALSMSRSMSGRYEFSPLALYENSITLESKTIITNEIVELIDHHYFNNESNTITDENPQKRTLPLNSQLTARRSRSLSQYSSTLNMSDEHWNLDKTSDPTLDKKSAERFFRSPKKISDRFLSGSFISRHFLAVQSQSVIENASNCRCSLDDVAQDWTFRTLKLVLPPSRTAEIFTPAIPYGSRKKLKSPISRFINSTHGKMHLPILSSAKGSTCSAFRKHEDRQSF